MVGPRNWTMDEWCCQSVTLLRLMTVNSSHFMVIIDLVWHYACFSNIILFLLANFYLCVCAWLLFIIIIRLIWITVKNVNAALWWHPSFKWSAPINWQASFKLSKWKMELFLAQLKDDINMSFVYFCNKTKQKPNYNIDSTILTIIIRPVRSYAHTLQSPDYATNFVCPLKLLPYSITSHRWMVD